MKQGENSSTFNWKKFFIVSGIIVGVLIVGLILFRLIFVTFVESYQLGYEYIKYGEGAGKIDTLPRTGYFVYNPIKISINTVDLRPMQVRIEANNRVLNAKLVKFRSEGLLQFVAMHGRGDYEQGGASGGGGTGSFKDIMLSYAYESYGGVGYSEEALEKKYKFLDIITGTGSFPNDSNVARKSTDSLNIAR